MQSISITLPAPVAVAFMQSLQKIVAHEGLAIADMKALLIVGECVERAEVHANPSQDPSRVVSSSNTAN